jgi:trigger factor
MKTSVKNLTDTKVELTITLDKDDLAVAEQVALTKLARDVKVAGFRKGKAPASVAAKNVSPAALQEQALDDAISKAVAESFLAEDIQVLERPTVEVKKYVPGEVVEFTAEAQILPKVVLGDYKKLKVVSEKHAVSEKEVEEVIERMRQGFAEKKPVTRAAKNGDETIIDFVGKRDDVAFDGGTGTDYALTLGSNSFIPGFEEGIIGHKVGETFDLELTFPKDYHSEDLKGAKVIFTTTLKSLNEVVLPKIDDAFAKKTGPFTTAIEMKADIKRELLAQKEREAKEKLKDELVHQLVDISTVPLPEVLVADQAASIEQDFVQNLMYQGLSLEQYLIDKKFADKDVWLATEVKEAAEKRVQAGLVLAELSKIEKIQATADELEAHVELYKKQYANNPEALKQFETPDVRRDIANRLLTEKTVDKLLELNGVK